MFVRAVVKATSATATILQVMFAPFALPCFFLCSNSPPTRRYFSAQVTPI